MNGIVTGKQEKQAGSLVWKNALTGSIPTHATALMYFYVPNTSYLEPPYFLKIESFGDRVAYISMRFVMADSNSSAIATYLSPNEADWVQVIKNYSDPGIRLALGVSDNFKMRDNLSSVEIGTFE